LVYSRHYLLLTAFAALMAWVSKSSAAPNLVGSFALYGGLHAAALVLARKVRRLGPRESLFIAAAAALSAMILAIGMLGRPLAAVLPDALGRYALLAFSAAAGAVTYGIAIRLFGILVLTPRAIGKIALGCALAAVVGLWAIGLAGVLSPWWIAVPWWYAFSAGLWCFHGRHGQGLSGECTCSGRTPSPRN
jgi:hypothetical protein